MKVKSPTFIVVSGNSTGLVTGIILSFAAITVSSLLVPVIEGFQQKAWFIVDSNIKRVRDGFRYVSVAPTPFAAKLLRFF